VVGWVWRGGVGCCVAKGVLCEEGLMCCLHRGDRAGGSSSKQQQAAASSSSSTQARTWAEDDQRIGSSSRRARQRSVVRHW